MVGWLKTGISIAGAGRQVGFECHSRVIAQGIHGARKGHLQRAGAAACPPSPLILRPQHRLPHADMQLCHLISILSLWKAIFPDYW